MLQSKRRSSHPNLNLVCGTAGERAARSVPAQFFGSGMIDGDLVFKTLGELSAEQKVAVSEIAQERDRDGIRTLKIKLCDKLSSCRTSPSCSTNLSTVGKSAGRTAGLSR
jgi:hypothetical protein